MPREAAGVRNTEFGRLCVFSHRAADSLSSHFFASADLAYSPATWRVATLSRFQTLMVEMAMSSKVFIEERP